MRNMSFMLTESQLLDGSKDVTRRLGWLNLKAGDRLRAVRKVQGLKKGECVQTLAEIEVVSVRREQLDAITPDECVREGFPAMTPDHFVEFFCKSMSCSPRTVVTRVEFKIIQCLA